MQHRKTLCPRTRSAEVAVPIIPAWLCRIAFGRSFARRTSGGRYALQTHEMKRLQADWYVEALAKIDAAEEELIRRKAHQTADIVPYDPFAEMSEEEFDRQLRREAEETRTRSSLS